MRQQRQRRLPLLVKDLELADLSLYLKAHHLPLTTGIEFSRFLARKVIVRVTTRNFFCLYVSRTCKEKQSRFDAKGGAENKTIFRSVITKEHG